MLQVFLLFVVTVSAQTAPKVATYKGYEFSFYTNEASGKLTYDDAKQVCVDAGARLAEIKSADVQVFITTQLTDLGLVESFNYWVKGYWIGGVCGGGKNNWKWEDGTSIGGSNYENWFVGCGISTPYGNGATYRAYILPFEAGSYGIQTCNRTLGAWVDDDKSSMKNWICMKVDPLTVEYKGYLYNFYNAFDGQDQLTYDDAKQVCLDAGARLAEIKSADVQDFITTQLTDLGLVERWNNWNQGYWIGGVCGGGGSAGGITNWKWEDGTSMGGSNYQNWYDGCGITEPNSNFASSRAYVYPFETNPYCSGFLGTWADDDMGNIKKWICMKDIDECESNPCKYEGSCVDGNNQFTCDCVDGYTGVTCETDINECSSNPCRNGGLCVDGINQFTCNCPDGYTGVTCQTDIDECESDPCMNGGSCVDEINQFTCNCTDGYTGVTCEIDLCPCKNGGTCNYAPAGYQCNCADGFIGDYCQTDSCDPNPCENGGTCNHAPGGYQCNCADGFDGDHCQIGIPLISVDGAPTFSLVITRNQTQSISLTCGVNQQFDPSTSFIWMKNKDIKSGSNSLTIDNLGSADLGLYSCITNDTIKSFATTVYLDVQYPPEQFKVINAVNNECEWDLDGVQSCTILFQLNPPIHNASLTKDGLIVSNDFQNLPQNTRIQQFIFMKNQPMKKDAGLYKLTITSAKFDPVIYEFTIDLIVPLKDYTATIVGAVLGSIITICFVIIAYLLFDRNRNKNVKSTQCKTRNEVKLNVALSDDYLEIGQPNPGTSTQDIPTSSADNHIYEKMSPNHPTQSVYQNQI